MAKRYTVELSPEARADLRGVKPFHRPAIVNALAELEHQAEVETKNRKRFTEPLQELPEATWEVRVGDYRSPYRIMPAEEGEGAGETVSVLRVIFKGTSMTRQAVSKARKR